MKAQLRNLAFLATVVALAVIGCGGNGGGSNDTGGDTGGAPTTDPTVTLESKPGQIELAVLTGQARTPLDIGDLYATVNIPEFTDTRGETITPPQGAPLDLKLNAYGNNIARINVPISTIIEPETGQPLNSRRFEQLKVGLSNVRLTTVSGTVTGPVVGIPSFYPMSLRVFPGRYTIQPVFLDDAMVEWDSLSTVFNWVASVFDNANNLTVRPSLYSFISDNVRFDISGLPNGDRPTLSNGSAAGNVFFSGDNYSIAQSGATGVFQSINRTNFDPGNPAANLIEGRFAPPGSVGNNPTPGTYSLLQPNPTDPNFIATITSLQGIWRDYTKMVKNMPEELVLTFPSSKDDDVQDAVFIKQTVTKDANGNTVSATISRFYYGFINLGSGEIKAYPVKNITTASIAGECTGTVGTKYTKAGITTVSSQLTRSGTYSGLNIPGFSSSGKFLVYRY